MNSRTGNENAKLREVCQSIAARQQFPRGPQKIADVLGGLFAKRGYAQVAVATEVGHAWQQAVGPALAAQTQPGVVRRGVLEVVVSNSAVMQELTFQKQQLLRDLAVLLSNPRIRDVRFRVGA